MARTNHPISPLSDLGIFELLRIYGNTMRELRSRGAIRTENNPIADISELIFSQTFGWKLETASQSGYDAIDNSGNRFQIKGRRLKGHNKSRQLSTIRNLDETPFDFLAGVIFDENFDIYRAALIPVSLVQVEANYSEHVNGWIYHLRDSVWDKPNVKDVTKKLRQTSQKI